MKKKPFFILGSGSPRRKSLLKEAGFRFKVIPSGVREKVNRRQRPASLVKSLARQKAVWVAERNPNAIVLGADTLVFLKGKILGKPKGKKGAEKMLRHLSGQWQRVYTGVAVAWDGGKRVKTGYGLSYVKIKKLTPWQIEKASKKHLDKAGAYAIQEKKDPFVERLKGDYDNVVGLPVNEAKRLLGLAARLAL